MLGKCFCGSFGQYAGNVSPISRRMLRVGSTLDLPFDVVPLAEERVPVGEHLLLGIWQVILFFKHCQKPKLGCPSSHVRFILPSPADTPQA